jgi:hypothetical protein
MNWRIPALIWLLLATTAFAHSRSISFSNSGTNELFVTRVLCDGEDSSHLAPGILIPGSFSKTLLDSFPKKLPAKFRIEYRIKSEAFTDTIDGKQVSHLLKAASVSDEITLHFVYSDRGWFIAKVEGKGRRDEPYERKLWPDENSAEFQRYKQLVRAAYDGNAANVREQLQRGAAFAWPDNPVTLTPLEWAVRWNHMEAFQELLKFLPEHYSIYSYAHCIKLATQPESIAILGMLLSNPFADRIGHDQLQEIFYTACYSAKSPRPLQMLLERYPVGVDYRVRDYGHTLLFAAVQGRNPEIVEWLMKHGADTNAVLRNGSKAIDHARDGKIRQLLTGSQDHR